MDLLKDNQKRKRDPQTIFVCNWHPSLSRIPSILKEHYRILQSDERLSNVFQEVPTVAFRRPRTIRNHLVRNDIRPAEKKASSTSECGSCILGKNICKNPTVTNTKKKITVELKDGGNCKTKNLGMQCEVGLRKKTYNDLAGSVLSVWNQVESVLTHDGARRGSNTKMQVSWNFFIR